MKISAPATLTGLAVGNALGMPFEGCHYRDTILESWDGESFLAGEHRNLKSGQWAAATMMAKALAASLLAHRTYAPSDAAKRYLTWYQLGEPDHCAKHDGRPQRATRTGSPGTGYSSHHRARRRRCVDGPICGES